VSSINTVADATEILNNYNKEVENSPEEIHEDHEVNMEVKEELKLLTKICK
jgi:hypothetical protein